MNTQAIREQSKYENGALRHMLQKARCRGTREEGIDVGPDDWGRQPAGLLNMSLGQKR